MKKSEAIRKLTVCAEQFNRNLANRNILYVFSNSGKNQYFETLFLPRHYLHLTGVKLLANNIKSVDFYKLCLRNQLSPSVFSFHENGTTEMKLSVLPQIMNIHKVAKMVGDYDNTKSVLFTEKIVGSITACIGFVRDRYYYIPNTTLREDIRTITKSPQKKVLAIFTKRVDDKQYSECSYLAKNISVDSITQSDNLNAIVNLK